MNNMQAWEMAVIDRALYMAKRRHISKRDALCTMSNWLHRAADRLRDGRDLYTGVPTKTYARRK